MRVSKSSRFEKFEVIEKTLLTEMANQLDGYSKCFNCKSIEDTQLFLLLKKQHS